MHKSDGNNKLPTYFVSEVNIDTYSGIIRMIDSISNLCKSVNFMTMEIVECRGGRQYI